MNNEIAIEKAIKYLLKLKKSKILKTIAEQNNLKSVIEQLDSIKYELKREKKKYDEIR